MFPNANAPTPAQPWVRNVTNRADVLNRKASRIEHNAYALANTAKTSYELIDDRITNINTFTTGLFEQEMHSVSLESYADVAAKSLLYEYTSGDFSVRAATIRRIPFARYNELTVTLDGINQFYTTNTAATDINADKPLLPMAMATIPSMARLDADGTYTENALNYGSRWTVEHFEPFLDYNIPGNLVPSAYNSNFYGSNSFYPKYSSTTRAHIFLDGFTAYTMRYTRQWLLDYMLAIRDYTMLNFPPAAGSIYLPPDVNQVEIVLGYYYQPYISATATNSLYINDSRLVLSSANTFILEGIRNLGY